MEKKWFPLDVFLISAHAHYGHRQSRACMDFLSRHPAVRSYGMGYSAQADQYMYDGRINTLFIDPCNASEPFSRDPAGADPASYIAKIRDRFPNIVVVLYTHDRCLEMFTDDYPRFRHFFSLLFHPIFIYEDENSWNQDFNGILERCEEWHTTRFEYDIALSFAGEDREFAEGLAALLTSEGARVFYDKYEDSRLFGVDLYTYLADVYSNRCRYCVLLSSKHYAEKMWTSHERRSAQERALKERGAAFILPIRMDDTRIPGLSDLTAYRRASEGLEKVAEIITNKLWLTNPDQPKQYIGRSLY